MRLLDSSPFAFLLFAFDIFLVWSGCVGVAWPRDGDGSDGSNGNDILDGG